MTRGWYTVFDLRDEKYIIEMKRVNKGKLATSLTPSLFVSPSDSADRPFSTMYLKSGLPGQDPTDGGRESDRGR